MKQKFNNNVNNRIYSDLYQREKTRVKREFFLKNNNDLMVIYNITKRL